jgi:hypothetical protein
MNNPFHLILALPTTINFRIIFVLRALFCSLHNIPPQILQRKIKKRGKDILVDPLKILQRKKVGEVQKCEIPD